VASILQQESGFGGPINAGTSLQQIGSFLLPVLRSVVGKTELSKKWEKGPWIR